jgi:hypothetical protein
MYRIKAETGSIFDIKSDQSRLLCCIVQTFLLFREEDFN